MNDHSNPGSDSPSPTASLLPDVPTAVAKPENAPEAETVLFDVILTPHRSLGNVGFRVVMGILIFMSLVGGVGFAMLGAWPVFAYFGLDIILIYVAFRASYRSGRLHEIVRLTSSELLIERVQPSGKRQSWRFQPYWLRVEMDDPPEHESALKIWSHGRSLIVGAFLTPEERLELAEALREALDRARLPAGSAMAQEQIAPASDRQ